MAEPKIPCGAYLSVDLLLPTQSQEG